jgi:hypothetical protein
MKRKLAAVVVCVAMLGIAGGQPPMPSDVPSVSSSSPPVPVVPAPSLTAPAANTGQLVAVPSLNTPAPPVASVPPTFDTLVQELQAVRRQKALLETREKAITEALLKKFAEQKSQLEALGVMVTAPVPRDVPKLDDVKKDDFKKEDIKKPVGQ